MKASVFPTAEASALPKALLNAVPAPVQKVWSVSARRASMKSRYGLLNLRGESMDAAGLVNAVGAVTMSVRCPAVRSERSVSAQGVGEAGRGVRGPGPRRRRAPA